MNQEQLKKLAYSEKHNKIICFIMVEYSNDFDKILNKFNWCFNNSSIEKKDLLNIFLYKIPEIVKNYTDKKGASFKTYLCNNLKNIIFNYSRKQHVNKYRILNEYIRNNNGKYCLPTIFKHPELNYSVLTQFEYSVFLTIFEANKTISQASRDHRVMRYTIEYTLCQIKLKMKKQLQ